MIYGLLIGLIIWSSIAVLSNLNLGRRLTEAGTLVRQITYIFAFGVWFVSVGSLIGLMAEQDPIEIQTVSIE